METIHNVHNSCFWSEISTSFSKVYLLSPALLLEQSIQLRVCYQEYFTGRNHEEFDYVFILPDPQRTAKFSVSQEIASSVFNKFGGHVFAIMLLPHLVSVLNHPAMLYLMTLIQAASSHLANTNWRQVVTCLENLWGQGWGGRESRQKC